ncbi:type II secretory pathway protein [Marinomonas piezotolerans]|uniref:Type II secretory pathway protein n=1 Tax=Marinomonas piezotolerans TaxID=2213058 RepID=A0A370U4F6_9GAMM|nr:type II secretory pathway protein [Marinomonas piezotolerans]RDL42623.1 type II secretory pathway protein [Marinomonas piezotolerans]
MFRFIVISVLLLCSTVQAYPLDPFVIKQSPLADFATWVSEQTQRNIILGKAVEGNISINVSKLDDQDLIPLFKKVMAANGYSVQEKSNDLIVSIDTNSQIDLPALDAKVYALKHIRNTKALTLFNMILSSAKAGNATSTQENENLSVIVSRHSVDPLVASNSLLVIATKAQLANLDGLVSQIDLDIKQVMIQAIILEMDVSDREDLGVNLESSLSKNGFSVQATTNTSQSTTLSALTLGGYAPLGSAGSLKGLISALVSNEKTKILSTPNILVMDRELGHISVGQNVPFLVSTQTTDGGVQTQSIERRDVGVSLSVTPHVLASGEVVLKISQESSSVTSNAQARDIVTNKRSISTVARVINGETIALGGLISNETRRSVTGVPVLMNLPLLGRLFKSESEVNSQKELMVFIKTMVL